MTLLHSAICSGKLKEALDLINGKTWAWGWQLPINSIRGISLIDAQNWDGDTPLHLVIANYSKNPQTYHIILEALLKAKAKKEIVNYNGYAALHLAATLGLVDVVELLLSNGAMVDTLVHNKYKQDVAKVSTALGCAALHGHEEIIVKLLKHGANVKGINNNANAMPPLHAAAASGKITAVELLLKHGADVNVITGFNIFNCRTALWYAMDYGFKANDFSIAKLLLMNGADPNAARSPYVLDVGRQMALKLGMRNMVDDLLDEILEEMNEIQKINRYTTSKGDEHIKYKDINIYISHYQGPLHTEDDFGNQIRYKPGKNVAIKHTIKPPL